MPAFYDFFRKIAFKSNPSTTIATIEADSTTDTASIVSGTNIAFTIDDTIVSQPNTLDQVTIIAADFSTYVPLGTTKLRLEKDLNSVISISSEIEIYADPLSPILVTRSASNQITISANSPTLPFSQEQIEDFSANMLTGGTHTNITVTYNDNGSSSGTIDLAATDTLQTATNRGASSTNAITVSNATSSADSTTGALKLTAGGLAVFENINAGGYVRGDTLKSTVAIGTAPLTVTSTTVVANLHAATADKWHTARTVTFTGDVTGSFSIDGTADVSNVSLTVGSDTVALGTDTSGNYVATGAVSGNGLSGASNSEGGAFTVSSNATALNTGETIVFRDASGNFSAGTISAALNGNASTVTNGFYTSSSFNLGTTSIAVNRAVAAQSLSGIISIDGYSQGIAGGNPTTLLGSVLYQSNTNATSLLSPNTTTTKLFLSQTGTGANGAVPAWSTVTATNVGLGNVTNESKATMFTNPTFTGNASVGTNTGSTLSINNAIGTPGNTTNPTGYMTFTVNGTTRYIPYYT
jgi:hypothetical protein